MYQSFYTETMEGGSLYARSADRTAILNSIRLLKLAEEAGPNSKEAVEALLFLRRLWEFFLQQLADDDNQLPPKMRADLISVGIGLLKEADAISLGKSKNFAALREISQSIADGLV
jgi:flagellar protein FlaF